MNMNIRGMKSGLLQRHYRWLLQATLSAALFCASLSVVGQENDGGAAAKALAIATVRDLNEARDSASDPAEKKRIATRMREILAPYISNPKEEEMFIWKLGAGVGLANNDTTMEALSFEAISRLKPDYFKDPDLLNLMGKLNAQPIDTEVARLKDPSERSSVLLAWRQMALNDQYRREIREAAKAGNVERLRKLGEAGADLKDPLLIAVTNADAMTVDSIVDTGLIRFDAWPIGQRAIWACYSRLPYTTFPGDPGFLRPGASGVLAALLRGGAPVDTTLTDTSGSLLYSLINTYSGTSGENKAERFTLIKILIDHGANLGWYRTATKETFAHMAASAHDPRLITFLAKAGVKFDQKDKDGLTPLHSALKSLVDYGSYPADELITALVDAGADVKATDNGGKTALHYAAESYSDSSAAISKLIDLGADPNGADQDGNTPLHFAMTYLILRSGGGDSLPRLKVVALVNRGAKINAMNKAKETPLSSCPEARSEAATLGISITTIPNWLRELGAHYSHGGSLQSDPSF
jgi:hypothetical protein